MQNMAGGDYYERVPTIAVRTPNVPLVTSEKMWMHLVMCERLIDGMPYYLHLAKLAVQSTKSGAR